MIEIASPLRRILTPTFPSRRTLVLVTAAVVAVLATASMATASNPFVAGERSVHELPLGGDGSTRAIERAATLGRALGLSGGAARARRYDDRFEHATYDEVTTVDAVGHRTSVVRLGLDGRLVLGVALGLHDSSSTVTSARAAAEAVRLARAAGIDIVGQPAVVRSQAAGGWLATWARTVAGAPVRGDGTRVALWADGTLHSIGTNGHALAPLPATVAAERDARDAAARFVAGRFGTNAPALAPTSASLAWVAPNDTWDASRPDAPDAVAHLAWVVGFRATGGLADRLTAIEVWLDAGSLALIGGDVAR